MRQPGEAVSNVVQLAITTVRQRHGIEAWPPGYAETVNASIDAIVATMDCRSQSAVFAAVLLLKTILREAEKVFARERELHNIEGGGTPAR